jgi:hypothetical protein
MQLINQKLTNITSDPSYEPIKVIFKPINKNKMTTKHQWLNKFIDNETSNNDIVEGVNQTIRTFVLEHLDMTLPQQFNNELSDYLFNNS